MTSNIKNTKTKENKRLALLHIISEAQNFDSSLSTDLRSNSNIFLNGMGAILYKYADKTENPTFIFNVGLVQEKNQTNNIYFLSVQTPSKNTTNPGYKTISSHYSYDPAQIILTIKKTLKPQNFKNN